MPGLIAGQSAFFLKTRNYEGIFNGFIYYQGKIHFVI